MKTVALTLVCFAVAAPVAAGGPVVRAAFNKSLKTTILVDARGMSLYEYASDVKGQPPACIDDPTYHCSKHWVPLLATGKPTAAKGAKPSLVSTVKRADGKAQVAYAGHPLYYWKVGYGDLADKKPGDVFGQAYVGIWYVLSPTGKVITKPKP